MTGSSAKPGPKRAEGEKTASGAMALSVETTEMLDTLAREVGVSRSQVVRMLIKKEFQKGNRK